ncbi:hypothetical protein WJX84_004976 [Apatococcus fuscideae]|uniref:BZIP domain-containing protein n=1 Tax=Apatococcus fuscideae TaxID=2026836 RepID=A0AAW1T8G6_9CHLO
MQAGLRWGLVSDVPGCQNTPRSDRCLTTSEAATSTYSSLEHFLSDEIDTKRGQPSHTSCPTEGRFLTDGASPIRLANCLPSHIQPAALPIADQSQRKWRTHKEPTLLASAAGAQPDVNPAERSRAAQRRYRERQKVRISTNNARREQLDNELQRQRYRNAELEQHAAQLEASLRLAVRRIYQPHDGPVEVLQERLTRQTSGHRIKALMLDEGKVAVLNVSGPLIFSRQKIAALTKVEFLKVLKGLLKAMQRRLEESTTDTKAFDEAAGEFLFFSANLYTLNMKTAREALMVDRDTLEPLQLIPDTRWALVLGALQLTMDQKRVLVEARNEYLCTVCSLMRKQHLLGPVQAPLELLTGRTCATSLSDMISKNMNISDAIKAEENAYHRMVHTIYTEVLTTRSGSRSGKMLNPAGFSSGQSIAEVGC